MGLGQEFTDWLQNQPEEPVDVHPPPSDEEMNAYEELVRLSEEKVRRTSHLQTILLSQLANSCHISYTRSSNGPPVCPQHLVWASWTLCWRRPCPLS